jgi:hypothetical protein
VKTKNIQKNFQPILIPLKKEVVPEAVWKLSVKQGC